MWSKSTLLTSITRIDFVFGAAFRRGHEGHELREFTRIMLGDMEEACILCFIHSTMNVLGKALIREIGVIRTISVHDLVEVMHKSF